MERLIRIPSFNPYKAKFDFTRVISGETLNLIKSIRSKGFEVIIEPEDGSTIYVAKQKGLSEVLSQPLVIIAANIALDVVIGLVSAWLYDRLRRPKYDHRCSTIIEIETERRKLRYTHKGEPISDKQFASILAVMQHEQHLFQESMKMRPPDPLNPAPIYLEHTSEIVGWGRVSLEEGKMRVDMSITDAKTQSRMDKGELKGASVGGLVEKMTCRVCDADYVYCDHKQGAWFSGLLIAEISVVKEHVVPETFFRSE